MSRFVGSQPSVSTINYQPSTTFAALLLLASVALSPAQPVLAPPPEFIEPLPLPTTRSVRAVPPMTRRPPMPVPEWLQWGPVRLRPHLHERLSYGDGIYSQPGDQNESFVNEFSPGMLFELGDRWRLDYTPTLRFYSSSEFEDTLDHSISLSGGTVYRDWAFGLSQGVQISSEPLVETASQTDQQIYSTALTATYFMSTKMSLELSLRQNFRIVGEDQAQQLTDSRAWSTMDWLDYQFLPGFGAAVGIGGGYEDVTSSTDMTYEQFQGRINWQAGQKLGLVINAGFEVRQFLDSDVSDLINPIFGAGLEYQAFEQTSISLAADHTVRASYYEDQVTESTAFTASLRQRLIGKLNLNVSGGYRFADYVATIPTLGGPATENRQDEYFFFSVRLSSRILKRGTVGIFYYYSDNTSNSSGFGYSSSQVGFELGYSL